MKNKKKRIILAVVLVLAIVMVWNFTPNKNTVKEVEAEILQTRSLSQGISVTGNVEAKNLEEIILSTQQKVKVIHAVEGQEIKKNDPIVTVDTTDLEYQLSKHRLNFELLSRNLEKLQNKVALNDKKTFENEIKQTAIKLENAIASYMDEKGKFEKSEILFENGAISNEEFNSIEKHMNDLQSQVELSEIQLINAKNSLADFDTNLKYEIADQRNQVEVVKADIANVQDKISMSEIKANIDGTIVRLDIKENQYPTSKNSSIIIYDLSEYKIVIEARQYDAVKISQGQKASIKVKGLDGEYAGTVSKIDDAAKMDLTNERVKVKIEITINNHDDKIKAGYEADINITVIEIPNILAVNLKALQKENDGKEFVYVIENEKAVKKYV
ncbi:MAG: hypothetical protein APF76_02490 [Desulfitibacter sp. BRH_c19]|nr:MAG: hypothetical protein APF76_02490 [Desulfitibacter sp. BRH_c19]